MSKVRNPVKFLLFFIVSVSILSFSSDANAQMGVGGCLDPEAANTDSNADYDDGSCWYYANPLEAPGFYLASPPPTLDEIAGNELGFFERCINIWENADKIMSTIPPACQLALGNAGIGGKAKVARGALCGDDLDLLQDALRALKSTDFLRWFHRAKTGVRIPKPGRHNPDLEGCDILDLYLEYLDDIAARARGN